MSQIVELNDEAQSSINLEDDPENEIVEDVVEPQEKTEAVIKKRNPKKLKWDIDRKKNQGIIKHDREDSYVKSKGSSISADSEEVKNELEAQDIKSIGMGEEMLEELKTDTVRNPTEDVDLNVISDYVDKDIKQDSAFI